MSQNQTEFHGKFSIKFHGIPWVILQGESIISNLLKKEPLTYLTGLVQQPVKGGSSGRFFG